MDALLMCGGAGTRLDADAEKPLFEVGGRPMIDRVRDALVASRVGTVFAVGSSVAPRTLDHVAGPTIEAPGEGYVRDLQYALEHVDPPVLTVAADLPLLAGDAVDAILDSHDRGSLSVVVPAALKRALGVSLDSTTSGGEMADYHPPTSDRRSTGDTPTKSAGRELAPTGLNVVADAGDDSTCVTWDARLAVNVNRLEDARVAEALL